MPAAMASMAANEQGKFWEMHDEIFKNQRALEDADLEKYAATVGLDMAKYKADFTSDKLKAYIEADMEMAAKVNARGTPNFFVNGRNLRGAQPYEAFEGLIKEELEKAQKAVAAGTPAAEYYNKAIANGKTFEPLEAKVTEFDMSDRPFVGAADGDIVIAEFSDFQCPYCGRLAPQMKALTDDPELAKRVKVVFKHFPLSFHKQAKPAAIAAVAAGDQGKFWEMHDKIFANMKGITTESLRQWAEEVGCDMAKYDAYLTSGKGEAIVDKDMADARSAGVRGTPSIYINGRKFQSTAGYSPAAFKSVINKYFPAK